MGGYGNHEHMHYPHALMQNLWLLIFLSFFALRRSLLLYPRHLCRRVYSFRFSVRPFVCSLVGSFVSSFVIPERSWNLCQSFC